MKVLCITDQEPGADHSAVKGIFGGYLSRHAEVVVAGFSRSNNPPSLACGVATIPYRDRHRVFRVLARLVDLDSFNVVLVRNFTGILGQALGARRAHRFVVGYWHSFPHAFRRLFEARMEGRAVFRKVIEYRLRSFWEERIVGRSDFLIAMSPEFRSRFHPRFTGPFHALPMGVDFAEIPVVANTPNEGPPRLIYTGAIDQLRQLEVVASALLSIPVEFQFDLFSSSSNAAAAAIARITDSRIRLLPSLPRAALLSRLRSYDIGIGAIPENALYEVSSPTKTLEYYACGVPSLVTYLPEYLRLFDGKSAFFSRFAKADLQRAVSKALGTPRAELRSMGEVGREVVRLKRNYETLAVELFNFFSALSCG